MTLISDSHRFAFIHVPKTGGTSVKQAFAAFRCRAHLEATVATKHLPARELKTVAPSVYRDYFTFAFVRNPFDRLVSFWTYKMENPFHPDYAHVARLGTFDTWVRWFADQPSSPQSWFTHDADGRQLVDAIGRYESFEADLADFADGIGTGPVSLAVHNASTHRPWADMYSAELRSFVSERWAVDFDLFGYTPDN